MDERKAVLVTPGDMRGDDIPAGDRVLARLYSGLLQLRFFGLSHALLERRCESLRSAARIDVISEWMLLLFHASVTVAGQHDKYRVQIDSLLQNVPDRDRERMRADLKPPSGG